MVRINNKDVLLFMCYILVYIKMGEKDIGLKFFFVLKGEEGLILYNEN